MSVSRSLILTFVSFAAVFLTGVFSQVRAQENTDQTDMDLDVMVHAEKDLTGEQQLKWVSEQTEEAKRISFRVQGMLDQARKDKDILKITCLNDKLTQINVNLRGIEERSASLKIAVSSNETAAANQHFAILKVYLSRVYGLKAEAENCMGEVDVVLGETETTVNISDDITMEDPTILVPPDDVGVSQPPHASGFF